MNYLYLPVLPEKKMRANVITRCEQTYKKIITKRAQMLCALITRPYRKSNFVVKTRKIICERKDNRNTEKYHLLGEYSEICSHFFFYYCALLYQILLYL